MGDITDPFASPDPTSVVPTSAVPPPPQPYGQPPQPYGQPPQPYGQPPQGSGYAQPLPPAYPVQPAYPGAYGYAAPTWKRSWGVTMSRWGIAWAVVLVAGMILGLIAGVVEGETDPERLGAVTGMLLVGPFLYMLFFPWWVDHLVGRLPRLGAWGVHLAAGLPGAAFFALVIATPPPPGSDDPTPSGLWAIAMWVVLTPLSLILADLLKGSYKPRSS